MIALTMTEELNRCLNESSVLATEDSTHLNDEVWLAVDMDGDVLERPVQGISLIRDSGKTYICFNCPEK